MSQVKPSPKQIIQAWYERAKNSKLAEVEINRSDFLVICKAALDSYSTPSWLSQALNEGDGVYKP